MVQFLIYGLVFIAAGMLFGIAALVGYALRKVIHYVAYAIHFFTTNMLY